MHVVFRESHGLEESETPTDLGQSPGDLVVLSFSDSDLGAFAAGWHRGGGPEGRMPTLRLANLAALKHPLSVDTYVEQTLEGAKGILIRLIGGVPYWSYGLQQVHALAHQKGLALAVLPADGREDTRLDAYSTLPVSTLRRLAHLCDTGGEVAAQAALAQMALATGLYAGPVMGSKVLPECGAWCPDRGVIPIETAFEGDKPRVLITFYRAYLTAADTAPIAALIRALRARGFNAVGLFAPSLKAPVSATWLAEQTAALSPAAIVNATAFSGKGDSGTSPLDAAGVPVFQAMLATSNRKAWDEAERGLSPADLAMHVVLPEVDGRITGSVVSFKEPGQRDEHLQFTRALHTPEPDRIAALVDRVSGWVRLAARPTAEQLPVLVLSTYPGKDWQMAHAVGLDALASAEAMLGDMATEGYDAAPAEPIAKTLQGARMSWPLAEYRKALATLPDSLRQDLKTVWGQPEDDPAYADGALHFTALRRGKAIIALQPERGTPEL
ncbi:MAG: cobaltochelatase subunit CobN, partial [Ruegeria sp.]